MWTTGWRDDIWSGLAEPWDLLIIGGGITGAGILLEAARQGLRVLLVEQQDFAWGTSSRSSKLVHGGLRYLKEGKVRLTRDSVREREHLLAGAPGLVEPLDFLLATYGGERPGRFVFGAGLTIYDLLALRWSHRYYSAADFRMMAGQLAEEGLAGGYRYGDAQTDDARLVLRLLQEACASGGQVLNYARAAHLLRDDTGQVVGIRLHDEVVNRSTLVHAKVVVNATGAWADTLRIETGAERAIRPLRGSHLVFPAGRLPVAQAVSFLHPLDNRPVFLLPWENVTLVGTTDEDYLGHLDEEPAISGAEVAYLMAAVEARYPLLGLTLDDVLATFAGIRPVIGSGKADPSQESRDHVIWCNQGLISVTGGKLTTFRLIAADVLERVKEALPTLEAVVVDKPVLKTVPDTLLAGCTLETAVRRRLAGRYGALAPSLIAAAEPGELTAVPGTSTLWAELRWAARAEGVCHLDDLLLRRVRLGLLTPDGAAQHMPRIRAICQAELGWDDARWAQERQAYEMRWQRCYDLPDRSTIPDWQRMLAEGTDQAAVPAVTLMEADRQDSGRQALALILAATAALLSLVLLRYKWRAA